MNMQFAKTPIIAGLALFAMTPMAQAAQSIVTIGEVRAIVTTPDDYDPNQTYPIALGLSGGDQNQGIVEFCTNVYFTPPQLADYIVIAPINDGKGNFRSYDDAAFNALFTAIDETYPNAGDWLVMGTSNGGVASFNALAANPARFDGAIVMPGALNAEITPDWADLRVLLAVGSEDQGWQGPTASAEKELMANGIATGTYIMEGQGHIVDADYDIAPVFDVYFNDLSQ